MLLSFELQLLEKEGFTYGESLVFIQCMEDLNPDLDEDTALQVMELLRKIKNKRQEEVTT
jgi:hypothetical protein